MSKQPSSPRLFFRSIEPEDLPLILSWRNSDSVRPFMPHQAQITKEQHAHWYETVVLSDDHHYWIFGLSKTQELLGVAHLKNLNRKLRCAESGLYIVDTSMREQGLGREAYQAMFSYGLDELDLTWLYANILRSNNVSISFHRDLGFQDSPPQAETPPSSTHPPDVLRLFLTDLNL